MNTLKNLSKVFLTLSGLSAFRTGVAQATECGAATEWFVGH